MKETCSTGNRQSGVHLPVYNLTHYHHSFVFNISQKFKQPDNNGQRESIPIFAEGQKHSHRDLPPWQEPLPQASAWKHTGADDQPGEDASLPCRLQEFSKVRGRSVRPGNPLQGCIPREDMLPTEDRGEVPAAD